MAVSSRCPGCSVTLKLRDEFVGKNIKCPRCGNVFRVPSEAIAASPDPAPVAAPLEEEEVPILEPVRRGQKRHEEEDEEDARPRRRKRRQGGDYVPCPKCDAEGAERVLWTPWGSFYGPALFTHVRCPECGHAYNGRTGGSNLIPAIVFVTIPLLLILGIVGGLLYYAFVLRYQ